MQLKDYLDILLTLDGVIWLIYLTVIQYLYVNSLEKYCLLCWCVWIHIYLTQYKTFNETRFFI